MMLFTGVQKCHCNHLTSRHVACRGLGEEICLSIDLNTLASILSKVCLDVCSSRHAAIPSLLSGGI